MAGDKNVRQEYAVQCKGIDLKKEEALCDSIEARVSIFYGKDGLPARSRVNLEYLMRGGLCDAMSSPNGSQPAWEFELRHCMYSCSSRKRAYEVVAALKGTDK
jgi:hypothetical protein